jgi:acyl-CoA thioesterase I
MGFSKDRKLPVMDDKQSSFFRRAIRHNLIDQQPHHANILQVLNDITIMKFAFVISKFGAALAMLILMIAGVGAAPAPINIVAIGASNTLGWGVNPQLAYPARLQAMLRDRGYKVQLTNAGVIFDTTAGMLRRIDSAVPPGTRIVILQPGGNDLRFFGTREQRTANIDAMIKRLRARKIKVIVFDPVIPPQYYQWDGIHISAECHAMFASQLLPQIMAAIQAATRLYQSAY